MGCTVAVFDCVVLLLLLMLPHDMYCPCVCVLSCCEASAPAFCEVGIVRFMLTFAFITYLRSNLPIRYWTLVFTHFLNAYEKGACCRQQLLRVGECTSGVRVVCE